MASKYKLLSIDGGGIRGIIPARILAEIEHRTGKRIHELFNLIAGTSTGGILALGLTKPDPAEPKQPHYEAKEFVKMYQDNGQTIFPDAWFLVPKEIQSLVQPKYTVEGRNQVLNKYFGDTYIKEALTDVIITSYDTELRMPVFFTSDPKNQRAGDNLRNSVMAILCNKRRWQLLLLPPIFHLTGLKP